MDIGDHRMRVPALWAENEAFNILGYALMKARSRLAEDKDDDAWNAYKSEVPEVKQKRAEERANMPIKSIVEEEDKDDDLGKQKKSSK